LEVVAEMKKGFFSMQAAQSNRDLFQAVVTASESASQLARRQFEAGNINRLTLAFQEALSAEAALELARKQTEMEITRAELGELLGIQSVTVEWKIAPSLPDLPDSSALPSDLEGIALKQRLDLESSRLEVNAWQRSKTAARASLLPPIELGFEYEEEVEGTLEGPTIEASVPLFDRGQGARANADAQLRRSREEVAASENRVLTEVRAAEARVHEAHRAVELIRNRILPLRERIVEETQLHYNFMLQGVYQLLDAKREELKAREDAINSLRDFWIAWTNLERAVGGTLEAKETSP
jgi:cobalt-zinc-cadmium efflux system outer membrane protein